MNAYVKGLIVIAAGCLLSLSAFAAEGDPNSVQKYRTVQTRDPQTGRTITQQVPVADPAAADSDPNSVPRFRTVQTRDPQTGRLITQRVPQRSVDYRTVIQQRLERSQAQLQIPDEKWVEVRPLLEKVLNLQWAANSGSNFRNRAISTGTLRPGEQPRDRVMPGAGPEEVGNPDQGLGAAFEALLEATRNAEATDEQIAEKMTAYQQKRQELEADLKAAQEELRQLLTIRQQAQLVLEGVLN